MLYDVKGIVIKTRNRLDEYLSYIETYTFVQYFQQLDSWFKGDAIVLDRSDIFDDSTYSHYRSLGHGLGYMAYAAITDWNENRQKYGGPWHRYLNFSGIGLASVVRHVDKDKCVYVSPIFHYSNYVIGYYHKGPNSYDIKRNIMTRTLPLEVSVDVLKIAQPRVHLGGNRDRKILLPSVQKDVISENISNWYSKYNVDEVRDFAYFAEIGNQYTQLLYSNSGNIL